MITVVNYGAGNLRSVANTLDALGAAYSITTSAAEAGSAASIILPGVGHFGQMIDALGRLGLREPLAERARAGVPFLGICLGLQAMFESSEEAPEQKGLGLFPGAVRRFPARLRCPHMGWNNLRASKPCRLIEGAGAAPYVYFAHSFYCPVGPFTAAVCEYGLEYTAVLEENNLFGVQFHPEKSGPLGLRIMKNFVELTAARPAGGAWRA